MSMTILAWSITAEARSRERAGHERPVGTASANPAALPSPADLCEQFIASARKVSFAERLLHAALAMCPPAMLLIAVNYFR